MVYPYPSVPPLSRTQLQKVGDTRPLSSIPLQTSPCLLVEPSGGILRENLHSNSFDRVAGEEDRHPPAERHRFVVVVIEVVIVIPAVVAAATAVVVVRAQMVVSRHWLERQRPGNRRRQRILTLVIRVTEARIQDDVRHQLQAVQFFFFF